MKFLPCECGCGQRVGDDEVVRDVRFAGTSQEHVVSERLCRPARERGVRGQISRYIDDAPSGGLGEGPQANARNALFSLYTIMLVEGDRT